MTNNTLDFSKYISKEKLSELNNIITAAEENISLGDYEVAEEYLQDAAYLINQIGAKSVREQLAASYTINPLDFAK